GTSSRTSTPRENPSATLFGKIIVVLKNTFGSPTFLKFRHQYAASSLNSPAISCANPTSHADDRSGLIAALPPPSGVANGESWRASSEAERSRLSTCGG